MKLLCLFVNYEINCMQKYNHSVLDSFMSVWHKPELRTRNLNWEDNPAQDGLVGKAVVHFLDSKLMWESPVHCMWCIPRQVVLGTLREQVMRNKPASSTLPWPLLHLLLLGTYPVWVPDLIPLSSGVQPESRMLKWNLSSSHYLWSWCFTTAIETLIKTVTVIFPNLGTEPDI